MGRGGLLLIALAALAACGESAPAYVSPVEFDTARAVIRTPSGDSVPLLLEVARSERQHQFGLMARPGLDPMSGMVFLYPADQPDSAGFWMWRTRMPLDIAFMDSAGVILTTFTMQPCSTDMYADVCMREAAGYVPGVPYRSALEVNAGFFAKHAVAKGARLEIAAPAR